MGDIASVEQSQQFTDSLQFVQNVEEKNLGAIEIFRCTTPPYDYILDYKKSFVEDNEKMKKYLQLMNQIKNMQHKNLVKIHLCEMREENQMCIKNKKIHTYCNYYNFTLAEAINKKKITESDFSEHELVYIMSCLIELALYLKKFDISIGDYRPDSIYLSPEGYIKMYLLEVEEDNKHISYYKALSERQRTDQYVFAPEQLASMNNLEYDTKYDVFKADIFAMAMIILELITLDKTKFYYNESRTELKIGRIQFDISSISQCFSESFISFLKHCLQPDPNNRCTLEEANQVISYLRKTSKNTSYCIRLQDEEEKNKKNLKKEVTMSIKGQHILNGLQKKLTPSPIATLSSSTSSSFKIDHSRNNSRMRTIQRIVQ